MSSFFSINMFMISIRQFTLAGVKRITPHQFRHPYVKLKLKISLKIEIPNHQINDNLEFVILLCSIPIIWYEIFINGPPIFTNKMSKRFFF